MKTGTQFLATLTSIKEALAQCRITECKISVDRTFQNDMPDLSMWDVTFSRNACAWGDVKRAVLEIRNQVFSKTRLEDVYIERRGDVYCVTFCDNEWEESQDHEYETPDVSDEEFLSESEPDDYGDGKVASEWAAQDYPEVGWSKDEYDVSELKKLLAPIFSKYGVCPDDVTYYFVNPGTTLYIAKLDIDRLDRLRDADREICRVLGEDEKIQPPLVYYAMRKIGSSAHDLPKGLVKTRG